MSKECPIIGIALYLDCLECDDKICNSKYKYNKLVIGIDESYTNTGISIAIDGKLHKVTSINFKGCKNNIEKRKLIANILHRILKLNVNKAKETVILVERIRTYTGGNSLRPNYLKSTGALIATIVDTAYDYGVPVYSVDTNSWKTQVVGTNKILKEYENEIKPEKMGAIKLVEKLGFDMKQYDKQGNVKKSTRGKHKGKIKYNDDAADSACIALYGFIPKHKQKLELEH